MAIVLKKAQFGTYQELSSFTAQLKSQNKPFEVFEGEGSATVCWAELDTTAISVPFNLVDPDSQNEIPGTVCITPGRGFAISFYEHSDFNSEGDKGHPIVIGMANDEVRVSIDADINIDGPTHQIVLTGARCQYRLLSVAVIGGEPKTIDIEQGRLFVVANASHLVDGELKANAPWYRFTGFDIPSGSIVCARLNGKVVEVREA